MAERSIEVRLRANITQYQAAMGKAAKDTRDLQRGIADAAKASSQFTQSLGRAGIITSGAFALGLGLSAKAAVDFESAMTGVAKTFPGTQTQLAAVSDGIRNMSKELPASTSEIAAVAEAAGQLGIEAGSILGFSRTMIDLGETTNMAADEAATALARLANITQMPQSEFDRLGSTVVALGNNLATTESEIVEMGLRIAGAGAQIGLAESDILGFAAALSSVGIESQAGGSAISRVMIEIASEVETTGENLATFARVAGMSAEQFSEAYRTDAAGALVAFVEGLGNMESQGQSTLSVLAELGIEEIRMRDALLRASGAGDLLRQSLELGEGAWEENTALLTEAEQRYATTASQMEILRNKISDLGVDTGATLLPALNATVGVLGNFADGLAALPAPAKTATTVLAGASTVVAGVGGAALLAAPKIKQARDALVGMGGLGATLGNNLGKISAGLAGVGVAVGVGVLAYERATRSGREYDAMVTELQQALSPVAEGQQELNDALAEFYALQSKSLGSEQIDTLNTLGVTFADIQQAIEDGADALDPLRQRFADLGVEIRGGLDVGDLKGYGVVAREVADDLGVPADALQGLIDAIEDWDNAAQDSAERTLDAMVANDDLAQSAVDAAEATNTLEDGTVNYVGVLRDLAPEQEAAGDATSGTTEAMEDQEAAAARLEEQTKALEDAINAMFGAQLSAESAAIGAASAYADMEEALADTKTTLDLNTEAGRANREALSGAADAALRHVQALIEQGASTDVVNFHLSAYRDRLAETMRAAGFAESEISSYIATLGLTPENIATVIELYGVAEAEAQLNRLTRIRQVQIQAQVTNPYVRTAGPQIGRHAGGPVPGTGNTDSVPALLTPGEFVVRKEAVQALGLGTLWRLNAAHFATGGLAGLTDAVLSGPLGGLWRRDQTAEMLKGTAAGQRVIAGARDDDGKVDVGKAMADLRNLADTYLEVADAAGTAAAEQLAAHEHLSSTDFDRVAGEIVETAEALREMAEEAAETRRKVQDVRFEIGELGTDEYLSILRDRLAGEERYSDEWLDIWTEIDSIESDLVDARKERLDDLADVQEDAFDRLVDLLNQQADIQAKIEQATAAHHAKLRDLERSLADDQTAAIRDRADALSSWASIEERSVIRWGNTVGALTANVRDQVDQFAEWQDALNRARGRGVSEAVVDMLGLAEGPQALGQLRMFMSASEEEIAALNAAVGQRQAQAGEQAQRESTQAYSELGRQLADMQARFAGEVEELNEEFLAEQRALTEELASLGQDQGRSYGEALAEGLASQIPGVQAAAQALRDAMAGLDQARAPAGGSGTLVNTETGRAAFTGPAGEGGYATKPAGVAGAVSWKMPDGRTAWYVPGAKIQAGNLGALRGYASGSPFVPSDGPAFLHRGERVFSASDNSALVRAVQQIGGAPPVNVVAEVYVDGQRMVDDRIKVVLRDNRTGTAIAGSR